MRQEFYLDLAASGLRMPVGTDLILHEHADPEAIMEDGGRLGRIMVAAAKRFHTPLALSLMDLRLEKRDLLRLMGHDGADVDSFHFHDPPAQEKLTQVREASRMPFARRNQAHLDAVRYVAGETDLIPVGMAIGPFSLMTKLIADPITAIAMAGMGVPSEDDAGVLQVQRCLALAEAAVSRSLHAQAQAGAGAIMLCEPAANRVYLSPRQIAAGSDIFEKFVIEPNLRLRRQLADAGVDLIFHDCGELTDAMVSQFATRLEPSILSLGSSRQLWNDARLVPHHIVLFGNLPTRSFYSDAVMPDEKVARLTSELIARMRETGHPHITGSECDVLHVPEAAETIRRKVEVMLSCGTDDRLCSSVD
jgi:uroporphyrinogen-III decarboxylase